jgi:hypothetical protein
MTSDKLKDARHKLLFGVRRSVRYHSRRRQFFDRYRLFTNAVAVIFGSATIVAVLSAVGKEYTVAAAALVTIFSAVDLVVASSRMARLHEDLYRRSIDLEKRILSISEDQFSEEHLNKFTTMRLDIEVDEPPIKRVLDCICHNELARALGYGRDQFVEVKWYQRLVAQLFDIQEHRLTKYGQRAA